MCRVREIEEHEYNEPLHITVEQWQMLLSNEEVFRAEDIEFLTVLYHFEDCKATASEIAHKMGKKYQSLNSLQSIPVKKIMEILPDVNYPKRYNGTVRYWHVLFLGGPAEKKGRYYWKLRPELEIALRIHLEQGEPTMPTEIRDEPGVVHSEGTRTRVWVNRYERSATARKKCIEHYGYQCSVCDLRFEELYGDIGKGFIEVHHLVPLHTIQQTYEVNPIEDLRPVCSNCHHMLHRANCSIEELKHKLLRTHQLK